MVAFDLVVRNGLVFDGEGGAGREADIGIVDGRIAAVGPGLDGGAEEIDASGRIVTPGFVDIHTHYDGQAVWDSSLKPSSWHGVTTAVMGNCGVGFAPVRKTDADQLVELMEGIEDIPGVALHEGLDWSWESFADFLRRIERQPRDMDICAQLPHGPLRLYVMGDRASKLEPATADDIAKMRQIACEAIAAGAIGFSTSRTLLHRTLAGAYEPSLRAGEDELTGIALGVRDGGGGVMELISDFDTPDMDTEFDMLARVVRASGQPLSLSLLQQHADPEGWRRLLARVEVAAAEGLPIKVQVAPRTVGTLLGLELTLNPFMFHESYQALAGRPAEEQAERLRVPALRARLLSETPTLGPEARRLRMQRFEMMFPFDSLAAPGIDYEPSRDSSIAALAAARGVSPWEITLDLLLEREGRGVILSPFANYASYNLDACREMMTHPQALIGLGDGGAHVGAILDASFPTYLLSHWGRDRARDRLDLGWLIKRQTADNADAMGLADRGRIRPGLKADLNVIDFDQLRLARPSVAHDLPAGGRRLLQGAHGYDATIVNGRVTYRHGEATGAFPGALVRRPARLAAE